MPTIPAMQLLTTHEAARLLQVDPTSIVKWTQEEGLPVFRTPGGHRRIRAADLLSFVREHHMFVPPELESEVRRVLLVVGDRELANALGRGLRGAPNVEVALPDSAIEALVQVGAWNPHVVVLDTELPDLNGLQVFQWLRTNPDTSAIEVVVLAGQDRSVDGWVAHLGAKALFAKPITAAVLLDAIVADAPDGASE